MYSRTLTIQLKDTNVCIFVFGIKLKSNIKTKFAS